MHDIDRARRHTSVLWRHTDGFVRRVWCVCLRDQALSPRVVRLSQIPEDAENKRLLGTEDTGRREISDGAQSEPRVSRTVEMRAPRLQVLEDSRVQHTAGELFQVEIGVVRRIAYCRKRI